MLSGAIAILPNLSVYIDESVQDFSSDILDDKRPPPREETGKVLGH